MTNPTSVPVIPAQPSSAFYTTASLNLFSTFDRASFQKAFGVDAPTYDPSRPPKNWFDSSLTAGQGADSVTYHYIDTTTPSRAGLASVTMPVADAGAINLPGVQTFPAYTIAPTGAYVQETVTAGTQQPFNPAYLSTLDEASLIASIWQLPTSAIVEQRFSGPFTVVYPAGETRRQYTIQWKSDAPLLVASLIAEMYANGVGAPGNWDLQQDPPQWISAVKDPGAPVLLPRPMPIRPLLPNEAIATSIFGSAIVYRTDMTSVYNPQTPQTSGGALTAAQVQMLSRIDSNLLTLLRSAGLPASS